MKNLLVKDIVNICKGTLHCGNENVICNSFNKDTRTITNGDVYIGIKGETFNGNKFYIDAFEKGAVAAIIEKESFEVKENYNYTKPIILVDNSIIALGLIAKYMRNLINPFIIGVTGSVGKTSTRDMIYSVVKENFSSLKTEGNFNNNIGMPLTLLRLKNEKAAVIEMGMNSLGEISYLSNIAKPNIAVITNIGSAHIGKLGSRENILKAKLEIIDGMNEEGILIINNDNDLLHEHYLKNPKNIITFGLKKDNDFYATDITYYENHTTFHINSENYNFDIDCPIPGEAFVYNVLCATAVASILNIPKEKIISGIANINLTKNRLEFIKIKDNVTLINDTYNASLDSVKSSIQILKNTNSKRKIAVLGDILELGNYAKEIHEQIGKYVIENNIDVLITIGENAKYIKESAIKNNMNSKVIYSFTNNNEAINFIKNYIKKDDCLLLKASNGMHFIEIVEELKKTC